VVRAEGFNTLRESSCQSFAADIFEAELGEHSWEVPREVLMVPHVTVALGLHPAYNVLRRAVEPIFAAGHLANYVEEEI
jgi:hypothetical protein